MKDRSFHFARLAAGALIVAVVMLAMGTDVAQASNMGFKANRGLVALGAAPIGQNRVALPYKNPYLTAQDLCVAFGLVAAEAGVVRQLNAGTGATSTHNCDNPGPFSLTEKVGVVVTTTATNQSGIIVGSHATNPPQTFFALGAAPIGQNQFPPPYHTTAVNAEQLCDDLFNHVPLTNTTPYPPTGAAIRQLDASNGATSVHNCNNPGPFTLVLGVSSLVTFQSPTGPVSFILPPGRPRHF